MLELGPANNSISETKASASVVVAVIARAVPAFRQSLDTSHPRLAPGTPMKFVAVAFCAVLLR